MIDVAVPELRLVFTLLLNAAIVWASWRLTRVLSPSADRAERCIDLGIVCAALVTTIIAALGWFGALNLTGLTAGVALVTLGTCALPGVRRRPAEHRPSDRVELGGERIAATVPAVFSVGLVLSVLSVSLTRPPLATDALIYHLPLAARWIQDGRIDVVPIWFHNPANTYSPPHASCLAAWTMLPMGNDVLARYVQVPFLGLCGLCMYVLLRRAGVGTFVAVAVAAGCCLSRSILGEGLKAKDDVILTAYFLAAMTSLSRGGSTDSRGWVRMGMAAGLMLGTKYTAVLAFPVVAIVIASGLLDRTSRRGWAWLFVGPLLLAGPWYLRNLFLTGNPVFPIEIRLGEWVMLPGLFATRVASEYRTLGSLVEVFVGAGQFTMRWFVMLPLVTGWAVACVRWRDRWRQAIVAASLVGPPLMIGVFYWISPFREIRFLFPAIALLFVAAGLAIERLPGPTWPRHAAAGVLLLASSLSAISPGMLTETVCKGVLLAAGLLAMGAAWRRWCHPGSLARLATVGATALVAAGVIYVHWHVYVDTCRLDYRRVWPLTYSRQGLGLAWKWLDEHASPDDAIANSGTPMTYPLMGFDLRRRVVYIPVQRGLTGYRDLKRIAEPLTSTQIVPRTVEGYRSRPDRSAWLEGLAANGVRFLLTTPFQGCQPIERTWAEGDPRFHRVFQFGQTAVYQMR